MTKWPSTQLSEIEAVASVEMLMLHKNFMNVVRVRWLTGEMVLQHLKDVVQASRVVDVDIGNTFVTFHEKRKLQVPKVVVSFKTAGWFEVFKLPRKVVQAAVDRMK